MTCSQFLFITISIMLLSACQSVPDVGYHPVCLTALCNARELEMAIAQRVVYVENHGWKTSMSKLGTQSMWLDAPYYRAWLEYSVEERRAFYPDQKKAIFQRLKALQVNKRPVYVVVYVHGWHHNADNSNEAPRNQAVAFDDMMGRQVDQVRRRYEYRGEPRIPAVLGIYVGWQGESIRSPTFARVLSIKSRADAADRIGHGAANLSEKQGLGNDLQEIAAAVRDTDPESKMIVIGHSFGGRMLTSALFGDFIDSPHDAQPSFQPLGPRTLIVTLNAAVGADCYDRAFTKAKSQQIPQAPTWINITSKDDAATSRVYPLAKFFGLVNSCNKNSPATKATIGHYRDYLTHSLSFRWIADDKAFPRTQADAVDSGLPSISPRFPPRFDRSFDFKNVRQDIVLAYPMRDVKDTASNLRSYDFRSTSFYEASLIPMSPVMFPPRLWNVETDRNTIDLSEDGGTVSALHSGIISTNLTRFLVDLVYELK